MRFADLETQSFLTEAYKQCAQSYQENSCPGFHIQFFFEDYARCNDQERRAQPLEWVKMAEVKSLHQSHPEEKPEGKSSDAGGDVPCYLAARFVLLLRQIHAMLEKYLPADERNLRKQYE